MEPLFRDKHKGTRSIKWIYLKPFFFYMVPVVMILGVLPGPSGKPIMPFSAWLPTGNFFAQVKYVYNDIVSAKNPVSSEVTVYRWKNSAGVWQYAQELPENISNFETHIIDTNASIISERHDTGTTTPQAMKPM
jgi:hypothetical protein